MVVMVLAVALLIGAGAWSVVLLVVVSLCKSAKAGDCASDRSSTGYLLGIDLSAHRRPTRTPIGAWTEPSAPPLAHGEERREMLDITDAAKALGVKPEVLLAWEARYGYPACGLSASGHGLSYAQLEISALAVALRAGLSVASAIATAQATTSESRIWKREPQAPSHLHFTSGQ
jgi:hypothetical protein